MKKEEFKRLLKEHGQVTIGINPFDDSEIYATYVLNDAGEVYEVWDIDQSGEYLCHIDDDTALQQLYDEVLCNVVSYTYCGSNRNDGERYHFDNAVAYIKANLEHWEIERGWAEIGKRMPLPSDTAEKIYCLLSDFSIDNDLPDDWWNEYDVEDFFMEIEND